MKKRSCYAFHDSKEKILSFRTVKEDDNIHWIVEVKEAVIHHDNLQDSEELIKMKKAEAENIIGIKEITNNVKAGKIKKVMVAKNCPEFLIEKLKNAGDVEIEVFDGDQSQLGTKLGKPFPVAMVGIKE